MIEKRVPPHLRKKMILFLGEMILGNLGKDETKTSRLMREIAFSQLGNHWEIMGNRVSRSSRPVLRSGSVAYVAEVSLMT